MHRPGLYRGRVRNTELRPALQARPGVEPATGFVVRAVIANLGLVAGVAFARSSSCGSTGRAA